MVWGEGGFPGEEGDIKKDDSQKDKQGEKISMEERQSGTEYVF